MRLNCIYIVMDYTESIKSMKKSYRHQEPKLRDAQRSSIKTTYLGKNPFISPLSRI